MQKIFYLPEAHTDFVFSVLCEELGFVGTAAVILLYIVFVVRGAQPVSPEDSPDDTVAAEFRGCESARTCRFVVDSSTTFTNSLYVVRPNGVLVGDVPDANSIAIRNRLNSLMSNMIHQNKRIELQDLSKLDDGTYIANVKVNGIDLSADPLLIGLTPPSNQK